MTDLSEDDLEALELADAHRYGHTARYAELTAKQLSRWRERAEKAEAKLVRVREALELAEVMVSAEGSWCRLCRTYGSGRSAHEHLDSCALSEALGEP